MSSRQPDTGPPDASARGLPDGRTGCCGVHRSPTSHRGDAPAMVRLGFLLLPQFTLSAFSLFLDPFRLAADEKDRSRQVHCQWRVMTLNGLPVQSSCGVDLYPTKSGQDCADLDWLVVVGGLMRSSAHADDRLLHILKDAARRGIRIIGLCTGVFSLAAAGLLDGETCCVSWFHRDEFVAFYDRVQLDTTNLFHFGDRHVTCAGGVGVIHVALEIIRGSLGEEIARKSGAILMVPRYWNHHVEQPATRYLDVASSHVRKALRFMEGRVADSPAMREVAAQVGVSVRQLERMFKKEIGLSPSQVMSRLQMEKARVYIEETDWSILEIALAAGYASPSHFSAVFGRTYGLTPSDYRRRTNGR